jgi:hypothetical protein
VEEYQQRVERILLQDETLSPKRRAAAQRAIEFGEKLIAIEEVRSRRAEHAPDHVSSLACSSRCLLGADDSDYSTTLASSTAPSRMCRCGGTPWLVARSPEPARAARPLRVTFGR